MKTKLTFLFAVLYFTGFSQTKFAPIGAEWHYSQYVSFNPPQANYIKHTCIKDSTIKGKPVKVIQKTKFTREGLVELGYEYLQQSGDTVSYWKNGEFHELYNYSLAKGDSMLIYSEMPNYCLYNRSQYGWINIDSTISQSINNVKLKGYYSSRKSGSNWGFNGFPIIERMGSLSYLLPQNEDCIMDMPGIGPLRCYSDPEFGTFYNGKEPCDTITTFPIFSPDFKIHDRFSLYPNPVTNYLTIDYNENGSFYLEMYNCNGNLVKTQNFCSGSRIDMSDLPVGLYFIIISNNNKYYYNGIIYKN